MSRLDLRASVVQGNGGLGVNQFQHSSTSDASERTQQPLEEHTPLQRNGHIARLVPADCQATDQLEAQVQNKRRSVEAKQAEIDELDKMLAAASEREQQLKAMLGN
ncbi:hypothetical protein ACM66B_000082 [Microbotryomycetes sp. NB124-2]